MSTANGEYDEIRHAYDDAFHRWSHAEASSAAEREYHRLRDLLARYILEHAMAVQRARQSRMPTAQRTGAVRRDG